MSLRSGSNKPSTRAFFGRLVVIHLQSGHVDLQGTREVRPEFISDTSPKTSTNGSKYMVIHIQDYPLFGISSTCSASPWSFFS